MQIPQNATIFAQQYVNARPPGRQSNRLRKGSRNGRVNEIPALQVRYTRFPPLTPGGVSTRDKTQTHGGLPIGEFIEQAMAAIKDDHFEAAIAGAKNLHDKRDRLFPVMNS